MATDVTSNNISNSATKMLQTNYSSTQSSVKSDDNAFSNVFDDASKSYADKDNKTSETSKNDNAFYARDTKEVNTSKTKNTVNRNERNETQQTRNDLNRNESNTKKSESEQNIISQIGAKVNNSKNNTSTNITTQEEVDSSCAEEAPKTETIADEIIKLMENTQAESTTVSTDDTAQTTEVENETSAAVASAIANESILANIAYIGTTNPAQATQNTKAEPIAPIAAAPIEAEAEATKQVDAKLDKIVSDIVKQPVETIIENLKMEKADSQAKAQTQTQTVVDENVEVTITNVEAQSVDTKQVKSDANTPAVDPLKIVVNLDETAAQQKVSTENTKPVTPTDTKEQEAPVIKVSDEVAAKAKENATTTVESKDFTSNAKNKAVEQMTNLQETDTIVVESEFDQQNTADNGNESNNTQNGQTSTVTEQSGVKLTGTEGLFGQSLDKMKMLNPAAMSKNVQGKELNQSDILSQVNAKFDELQKNGSSKVSIVLKPENLGKVSLEIMNTKEGIVAKMTTDSQQVKELFDKNVEALKSSLGSQGVNVNNIKVECTQESSNNMMGFEREQFNHNASKDPNNHREQTNQSSEGSLNSEYTSGSDAELTEGTELKNTQTIIQHNGKVDYKV